MKVNTDGVLLGALADGEQAQSLLDIGTGTGAIALMLTQRFTGAQVDAVEIDETASATASANFKNSPFAERLNIFHSSFKDYFEGYPDKKYDLIVSNPPFHINSLKSTGKEKAIARHTNEGFFVELMGLVPKHLKADGKLTMVLPQQASALIKNLSAENGLYLQNVIQVRSYAHSQPHREIITLGCSDQATVVQTFNIYDAPKAYSAQYRTVLSSFLTIF